VLTGETGAGKSIVLGALSLLAGGARLPRTSARRRRQAVVGGVFRTEAPARLEREARRARPHLATTRKPDRPAPLAKGGRAGHGSGQLLPIASLAELFAVARRISSQHDSRRCCAPSATRSCSIAGRARSRRAPPSRRSGGQREIAAELAAPAAPDA